MSETHIIAEELRLKHHEGNKVDWKKWGPYLSERQWGTVREDYSPHGDAWTFFPHDHARSRVYRWGEDGLAGISDADCNICFALGMWNGQDPIIKERLFGLKGPEGNHGEDVKELYYYLDNTPTHSYMKYLYKYPHQAYPYDELVQVNQQLPKHEREYEILDTGIFEDDRYFDVFIEYAKASPEDILIKITACNRGPDSATLTLLPTLWYRNLWKYQLIGNKPSLFYYHQQGEVHSVHLSHANQGEYYFHFSAPQRMLFTENETNREKIFGEKNVSLLVKDAINDAVVQQDFSVFEGVTEGTKCSPFYQAEVFAGESWEVRLRLSREKGVDDVLGDSFTRIFDQRIQEADEFYAQFIPSHADPELKQIQRQAFAGMLWTKQYYNIDMNIWLDGDPGLPTPPESRKKQRNKEWRTLNNEDIISMPDKWEFPWYATWDLAFHTVPLAMIDAQFAKDQLILFLREWYMNPRGQLPAYEWAFSDVNPPVHAWACMEVYRIDRYRNGKADVDFLKRVFQKLTLNFTWWVNRKDVNDNNIFEGGFLGLDNIGIFDRSAGVPGGGTLDQADGTSWMAMFCLNMLDMAVELSMHDPTYEDVATKFLEHFIYIAEALNQLHIDYGSAWNEEEGFFYDMLTLPNGDTIPLKIRSLVGLTSLFATFVLKKEVCEKLKGFSDRLRWFWHYRRRTGQFQVIEELRDNEDILLSLVPKERLIHLLEALLNTNEFYSDYGIRSVSKLHKTPYELYIDGQIFSFQYEPGESQTNLFGGNSNWRGPIWIPMNFLIIQSLRELHTYYGEDLKVACPTGTDRIRSLDGVADDISLHLISLFFT